MIRTFIDTALRLIQALRRLGPECRVRGVETTQGRDCHLAGPNPSRPALRRARSQGRSQSHPIQVDSSIPLMGLYADNVSVRGYVCELMCL